MVRTSWGETWLRVARLVAQRSTCPRASVGAVVVDRDNRLVATGYNGAPIGAPHCTEVGCEVDATGSCRRSVHAEANALIQAGRLAEGGTLYTTVAPCPSCAALIINARLARVVYESDYHPVPGVRSGVDVLTLAGVICQQMTLEEEDAMYNKTSLRPSVRSLIVDRDYMAHVARWSYAARLVEQRNHALTRPFVIVDVGCGVEAPLVGVLASSAFLARGRPLSYHGVDVGPIRPVATPKWAQFYPDTDVLSWAPPDRGDLVACFEVIEHMSRDSGLKLLLRLREFVRDDGVVLLSTPVADPRSLPRNHVYEWGLVELETACAAVGFSVQRMFGTFMDVNALNREAVKFPSIEYTLSKLRKYYTNEALSALFAPLFPGASKSIVLVLDPEERHGVA